jgi:hypothetical protein
VRRPDIRVVTRSKERAKQSRPNKKDREGWINISA